MKSVSELAKKYKTHDTVVIRILYQYQEGVDWVKGGEWNCVRATEQGEARLREELQWPEWDGVLYRGRELLMLVPDEDYVQIKTMPEFIDGERVRFIIKTKSKRWTGFYDLYTENVFKHLEIEQEQRKKHVAGFNAIAGDTEYYTRPESDYEKELSLKPVTSLKTIDYVRFTSGLHPFLQEAYDEMRKKKIEENCLTGFFAFA